MRNKQLPTFPKNLRDEIAIQAMSSLIASYLSGKCGAITSRDLVKTSYAYADLMLEEREKP